MSEDKSKAVESSAQESYDERSKHRGQWASSTEFILACLGNMVGFGNVWRFPYLVFKNGGGIFVLVYLIVLIIIGFPIILIESTISQYSQSAAGEVFGNITPIFKGVGYCAVAASALIGTYYNVLIAWTIFYFFEAFTQKWASCDHDYNTDRCITMEMAVNLTKYRVDNSTISPYENKTSSADEFFNRYMLNKTESLSEISWPQPGLTLSLLASTVFCVICLIKGVESSGKAVYFTALYPYVMLIILFIRGVTLKGAGTGIAYYLLPSLSNIKLADILVDSVVQVFFSIGAGMGNLFTFSSFNKFHSKLLEKLVIITIGDFLTSLFAGLVVFSMVGFIADLLGKSIQETVTEGAGLVFVVILEGISQMPLSVIFTFCFVSMLFFLGIDSLFGILETVNTFIHDYAYSKGIKLNKSYVTIGVGTAIFIGGLPMTTRSGIYILNLMDSFSAGLPILAVAIGDCIIITFIYGIDNFFRDFTFMTGTVVHSWAKCVFKYLLLFVVPWLIVFMFVTDFFSKIRWTTIGKLSSDSPNYPTWSLLMGWFMGIGPVSLIPIFMIIYLILSKEEKCIDKYKAGTQPTEMYHAAAVHYGSYDEAEKKRVEDQMKQ